MRSLLSRSTYVLSPTGFSNEEYSRVSSPSPTRSTSPDEEPIRVYSLSRRKTKLKGKRRSRSMFFLPLRSPLQQQRMSRYSTALFNTIRQIKKSEISFMRLILARVDQRMSTSFHDIATAVDVVVSTRCDRISGRWNSCLPPRRSIRTRRQSSLASMNINHRYLRSAIRHAHPSPCSLTFTFLLLNRIPLGQSRECHFPFQSADSLPCPYE